ncbi:37S ribosomal protein, mitochondrial [Hanseniaspora osmophila]|uniref:37S ribosomal protein, mitochondrial n=1 Tax=Hanseniaspora osmophila TaxID=56408 RepID=A0A1E5RB52_9ASCO|nr:37S ribosomal protein, mitochondrial [Hanseniaspora osmophila]
MGKGTLRFGGKSGILPPARALLKNPTTKQKPVYLQNLEEESSKVKTGYADNIAHPKGTSRESRPVEFLDVEARISKTIPEPTLDRSSGSAVAKAKANMAALRREYLGQSLRNEESRLLKQQELLEKKKEYLKVKAEREQAALLKSISIDENLTTPTLHDMMTYLPKDGDKKRTPIMRQRTEEEKEVLLLKRQHNRELLEIQSKERKLEELLRLFHVSEDLIVTEKDLSHYLDDVFKTDASSMLTRHNTLQQISANEESEMMNGLFGVVSRSSNSQPYVGLAKTTEFVSGEMESFLTEVQQKIKDLPADNQNNV